MIQEQIHILLKIIKKTGKMAL